jgi:hypothetical protein
MLERVMMPVLLHLAGFGRSDEFQKASPMNVTMPLCMEFAGSGGIQSCTYIPLGLEYRGETFYCLVFFGVYICTTFGYCVIADAVYNWYLSILICSFCRKKSYHACISYFTQ